MHRVVDSIETLTDCQTFDLTVDGLHRDYLNTMLLQQTNRTVGKAIPLGTAPSTTTRRSSFSIWDIGPKQIGRMGSIRPINILP